LRSTPKRHTSFIHPVGCRTSEPSARATKKKRAALAGSPLASMTRITKAAALRAAAMRPRATSTMPHMHVMLSGISGLASLGAFMNPPLECWWRHM